MTSTQRKTLTKSRTCFDAKGKKASPTKTVATPKGKLFSLSLRRTNFQSKKKVFDGIEKRTNSANFSRKSFFKKKYLHPATLRQHCQIPL